MRDRDDDKTEHGNKPVETLRDGALKLSIFRNSGERGDYFSMMPGRIYTDERTGEIHETSSLNGSEPLRMANLLTRGYERVAAFRAQDKENAKDAGRESTPRSRARDRGERER